MMYSYAKSVISINQIGITSAVPVFLTSRSYFSTFLLQYRYLPMRGSSNFLEVKFLPA